MNRKSIFTRMVAAALATLALGSAGAEALDLRSWDQKIDDPSRRFVVLSAFSSAAVLDKETQLVWERTPSATTSSQQSARWSCISKSTGGRRGWRLPYAHELNSLTDGTPSTPTLPAGHPFIGVVENGTYFYWTDTQNPNIDPPASHRMGIGFGETGPAYVYLPVSTGVARTWCVRGPLFDGVNY